MKAIILLLSVFLTGCNNSVDDYFNELTPPIVVVSADDSHRRGVMFGGADGHVVVIHHTAFQGLQMRINRIEK
jgi:hypothetical protein